MEPLMKMFGNVATDDIWKVSKVARMFTKLQDKGHVTMIWLNLYGAKVTDTSKVFPRCPIMGKDIHSILTAYIASGGQLLLGSECMDHEKIDETNVLPGITFVTPPDIMERLTGPNTQIFSYS